ncbi:MAG: preprotein translocase subunit SecE [Oceanospirillaceae bacterium]|jgi:preprotein translocase subunit SecE|nr:preprotein translocase subunit SecE [Oceanospirillaceae bacterium]MBT4997028.1 preprotein translocase subunit SecE [Oceanospirillaceae bacterium]MBT5628916.1 preprotein translocase subunit SecE [Oceanospirillaceae bacterium]MBT6100618.1 preprotein translocase subunit SecE [Oceanospirillaceae bacterium]MDB9904458.1 preprotein translocase subunit SecE [Oceanospirillaceae bacterium]
MSATPTTQNSRFDTIKWIFVLALVAAGVVGNSIYSDQSLLYRTLALVALAAVALFVALQTDKGRGYAVSFREARKEIRKVVWPNRQETTQTTLIVVVVVLIMALVLWGLDSLLSWAVSSLIG